MLRQVVRGWGVGSSGLVGAAWETLQKNNPRAGGKESDMFSWADKVVIGAKSPEWRRVRG